MVALLDRDGDSRISYEEFRRFVVLLPGGGGLLIVSESLFPATAMCNGLAQSGLEISVCHVRRSAVKLPTCAPAMQHW